MAETALDFDKAILELARPNTRREPKNGKSSRPSKKPVKMKVAPIERDLEQVVQGGDAAVTTHEQTPPNERVNLEVGVSR